MLTYCQLTPIYKWLWNMYRWYKNVFPVYAFVICKMSSILCGPQCVNIKSINLPPCWDVFPSREKVIQHFPSEEKAIQDLSSQEKAIQHWPRMLSNNVFPCSNIIKAQSGLCLQGPLSLPWALLQLFKGLHSRVWRCLYCVMKHDMRTLWHGNTF